MKLGDITEVGFYKEVGGEDLWESFKNTDSDEEYRKECPLLLDHWEYRDIDADDRKMYLCDGNLYRVGGDYSDLEVEKVTCQEYDMSKSGYTLIEKKPTYKERYRQLQAYLATQRPTGTCETCTEKANKEADKLRKEVTELKRYKGLFENCRKLYLDVKEQAHSMCEKLEDLEDSLKRTTCQAECYKHKEADKWKALIGEVVMYCEDQDLKNDITACNVISIIENVIEKEGV